LALPAFAGTSKHVIAPVQSEPSLWSWFTGVSGGYLTEFEEPMYHAHLGTDTPWNVAGWDVALFGEVGYTEKEESFAGRQGNGGIVAAGISEDDDYGYCSKDSYGCDDDYEFFESSSFTVDELEEALSTAPFSSRYKLRIIPVTANVKFERALSGNLNAYFGAGLGMANVDLSVRSGGASLSDDDWVFCAQVFAGLVYNISPAFEIYGGGRWIYFDDAEFGSNGASATLELDDDFLIELGGRFNF
jgi:opacity protein-like surface antigen